MKWMKRSACVAGLAALALAGGAQAAGGAVPLLEAQGGAG